MTANTILGSSVQDSPEVRPFAVLKWADVTPAFTTGSSEIMQFWAYDEPGSYDNINSILKRVRAVLDENTDVEVDDERYSTSKWNGDSAELYDDIFKCIVRYATFTIV